ncbi:MAG: AAA family ATPase [Saprospiraceae bacterium]|nr:AAA family ATPase [Saprospiraceae bacterium]
MGQSGGEQPERDVYLRTLANLTNPAEVRSVLQIGQKGHYTVEELTSDLIAFAHLILPLRYDQMVEIRSKAKNLLFALRQGQETPSNYSEFHMSAGERAILRLSKDLSRLKNALVLIDEIEAGLHPFTQQMLMLELLRLAMRNDLQIIVTTHSPVVLECVPVEGRIFLERTADNVVVLPAYRDVIQKALYGQSIEKLSILCEDEISESVIVGVLDALNPKIGLRPDDIVIGRDTGKDQFSQHIEALGKFKQLSSFVFVLDGDGRHLKEKLVKIAEQYGSNLEPLFLPGNVPEEWAWETLRQRPEDYAPILGLQSRHLLEQLDVADRLFSNATDHPNNIVKNKYFSFCEQLKFNHLDLMRTLARQEVQCGEGDIQIFADQLESQIRRWQAR